MGLWAAGTTFSASTPGKAGGLQLLRLIATNAKTILSLPQKDSPSSFRLYVNISLNIIFRDPFEGPMKTPMVWRGFDLPRNSFDHGGVIPII